MTVFMNTFIRQNTGSKAVYSAVIMTKVIASIYPVHLMNVD